MAKSQSDSDCNENDQNPRFEEKYPQKPLPNEGRELIIPGSSCIMAKSQSDCNENDQNPSFEEKYPQKPLPNETSYSQLTSDFEENDKYHLVGSPPRIKIPQKPSKGEPKKEGNKEK